jgi:hypothetical protein
MSLAALMTLTVFDEKPKRNTKEQLESLFLQSNREYPEYFKSDVKRKPSNTPYIRG